MSKTTVIALSVTSTIAVVSTIKLAQSKKQIADLKSTVNAKKAAVEVWERNFQRACDMLNADQLLKLMKDQNNDIAFAKIIFNNI